METSYDAPADSGLSEAPVDPARYADLVREVVTRIVDQPNEVEVIAETRGRTVVVEVGVAPDDMGKIIGKGGRNIDALRGVARAAGLRHHERVHVELLETDDEVDGDDNTEPNVN